MPHSYLSSVLDLDPLPIFVRVTQPALLITGEDDESVPVESARCLKRRLSERGQTKITLMIIPGADHALRRNGRDLKPDIMTRLSPWISSGTWDGAPS